MQKNCNQFLNAVKSRHNIKSDYKLAQVLGLTHSAISNYRSGRSSFDSTTSAKIAELLSLPPLEVIAAIEMERAKSDELRKFWSRYAAAAAIVGAVCLVNPSSSEAGESLHKSDVRVPNTHIRTKCEHLRKRNVAAHKTRHYKNAHKWAAAQTRALCAPAHSRVLSDSRTRHGSI